MRDDGLPGWPFIAGCLVLPCIFALCAARYVPSDGAVVGVVGAGIAAATYFLVQKQITLMNLQTALMEDTKTLTAETKIIAEKELVIVERQTSIAETQAAIQSELAATRADLTLFAKPNKLNTSAFICDENVTVWVYNDGARTASRFHAVIGIPDNYAPFFLIGDWDKLFEKDLPGHLSDYDFYQTEIVMNVYRKSIIQLVSIKLNQTHLVKRVDTQLVFSLTFEDGTNPPDPFTYYEMQFQPTPTHVLKRVP